MQPFEQFDQIDNFAPRQRTQPQSGWGSTPGFEEISNFRAPSLSGGGTTQPRSDATQYTSSPTTGSTFDAIDSFRAPKIPSDGGMGTTQTRSRPDGGGMGGITPPTAMPPPNKYGGTPTGGMTPRPADAFTKGVQARRKFWADSGSTDDFNTWFAKQYPQFGGISPDKLSQQPAPPPIVGAPGMPDPLHQPAQPWTPPTMPTPRVPNTPRRPPMIGTLPYFPEEPFFSRLTRG